MPSSLRSVLWQISELPTDKLEELRKLLERVISMRLQQAEDLSPLSDDFWKLCGEKDLFHRFTQQELMLISMHDLTNRGIRDMQVKTIHDSIRNISKFRLSNPTVIMQRLIKKGYIERSSDKTKEFEMIYEHHIYYRLTPKGSEDAARITMRLISISQDASAN